MLYKVIWFYNLLVIVERDTKTFMPNMIIKKSLKSSVAFERFSV